MAESLPTQLTLGFIPAATREPVVNIRPNDSLSRARTLMSTHDFSQLPVVRGKGLHGPIGVVSWESIGKQSWRSSEPSLESCIDYTIRKLELSHPLTDAIGYINRDGCVLVVDGTNALTGIVTVADLGERLADIATPFLELERCEQLLREAVTDAEDRLGLNLAVTAQSAHHSEGHEAAADDLTMGALVGILGADNVWPAEVAGHHTKTLRTRLGSVVEARNEVMHFRKLSPATNRVLADLASINVALQQVTEALRHEGPGR